MPRPKKPPHNGASYECCRCRLPYPTAANWPDGPVCGYCYVAAKRTRGLCADCGHDGVLPGRNAAGEATCRRCSGVTLNVDCRRCDAEAELYREGLCWACCLHDQVASLLAGPDGAVPQRLAPLADAIASIPRANSGITWLRNPAVTTLLLRLADGSTPLSHQALDELPRSRTVEYIRALLVERHILTPRDRYLADYERWLTERLDTISDPAQRRLLELFGRWHHLRRFQQQSPRRAVTVTAYLRAKQSTTVAGQMLAWLAQQNLTLDQLTQAHVDAWYAAGPSTREQAGTFLYWARKQRLTANLEVPRRSRDTDDAGFGSQERLAAIRRILLAEDDTPRPARVAASLVLLFGQPLNRLARLTLDDVRDHDGTLELRLGTDWCPTPLPLSTLIREHIASRPNQQTAANPRSRWLFPGGMPGRPLQPGYLSTLLIRHGVPARAARGATWRDIVHDVPPAVLAQVLGLSAVTAAHHAERSGSAYGRYAAIRVDDR